MSRLKRRFAMTAATEVAYQHHIYLPQWNLVYFYVPKVACTSIKEVLGELLSLPSVRSPHDYSFPKLSPSSFADEVNRCHTFAIVREPLSRLLSGYKSMVLRAVHDRHYHRGVFRPLVKYGGFRYGMSFEAFCRRVVEIPDQYCDPHIRSQSICFTGPQQDCLARHLIRFDALRSALPHFLRDITGRSIHLRKHNHTGSTPAVPTLSRECQRLLRHRFRKDFALYERLPTRLKSCP